MDLPTRLDLFSIGRAYIRSRALKLDPAQVDLEGSDANIVVAEGSVMGDVILRQLGYRTAALMLDGASNEDLDRLVFDRYAMTRKGASASRCVVKFARPAATIGAGTLPIGTLVSTDTGTEFITTTTASFGALDLETTARVRSTQAGTLTAAGAGAIKRFSKPAQIFDKSITVTNPGATAGGDDAEDDEALRNRARQFYKTARRGVLAAIEAGALAVEGVSSAQAVEVTSNGGQPARLVLLYVADSSGISNEVLANEVQISLLDFRAGGIQVIVSTSAPTLVNVLITLAFRANVDTVALRDNVQASIIEYINSLPVNATLRRGALFSVLQRYIDDGVIADDQSIVLPAGDLVPDVGQTLRALASTVTVNGA